LTVRTIRRGGAINYPGRPSTPQRRRRPRRPPGVAQTVADPIGKGDVILASSHELRTPLTVIPTALEVVLAKPNPTPAEVVSMSAEIRQPVDHAERLIEALLVRVDTIYFLFHV
jgi:signal transduction histidine kinase